MLFEVNHRGPPSIRNGVTGGSFVIDAGDVVVKPEAGVSVTKAIVMSHSSMFQFGMLSRISVDHDLLNSKQETIDHHLPDENASQ